LLQLFAEREINVDGLVAFLQLLILDLQTVISVLKKYEYFMWWQSLCFVASVWKP